MKVLWCEVKLGHFGIRDLDSFGISLARHFRFDRKARFGGGIADETNNCLIATTLSSPPVLCTKGKHPVFNFVPLVGSRREVAYMNIQSSEVIVAATSSLPSIAANGCY